MLIALSWIASNYKIFLYGILGLVLSVMLYKGVKVIQDQARQEIIIEQQAESLRQLQLSNKKLELSVALTNKVIESRDAEIRELGEKLDNVTRDLGDDAQNQAPESLKELFRRLNK